MHRTRTLNDFRLAVQVTADAGERDAHAGVVPPRRRRHGARDVRCQYRSRTERLGTSLTQQ